MKEEPWVSMPGTTHVTQFYILSLFMNVCFLIKIFLTHIKSLIFNRPGYRR